MRFKLNMGDSFLKKEQALFDDLFFNREYFNDIDGFFENELSLDFKNEKNFKDELFNELLILYIFVFSLKNLKSQKLLLRRQLLYTFTLHLALHLTLPNQFRIIIT